MAGGSSAETGALPPFFVLAILTTQTRRVQFAASIQWSNITFGESHYGLVIAFLDVLCAV